MPTVAEQVIAAEKDHEDLAGDGEFSRTISPRRVKPKVGDELTIYSWERGSSPRFFRRGKITKTTPKRITVRFNHYRVVDEAVKDDWAFADFHRATGFAVGYDGLNSTHAIAPQSSFS